MRSGGMPGRSIAAAGAFENVLVAMKVSDAELAVRRRGAGYSKAGRGLFLGLVTVVCILLFSTRLLWSFTTLFSGDASKLVDFAIAHREVSAQFAGTEGRLKHEENVVKVPVNATGGGNEKSDDDDMEVGEGGADVEEKLNDEKKIVGEKAVDEEKLGDENKNDGEEKGESDEEEARGVEESSDDEGSEGKEEESSEDEGSVGEENVSDAIAYLEQLALNLTKPGEEEDNGPYHNRRIFEADYAEMKRDIKIFVYPYDSNDTFMNIFKPVDFEPSGNYASEEYFQLALNQSGIVTKNASEATFFFMPVSITKARIDKRIDVAGLKDFCAEYVTSLRTQWSHWNRSRGADHFYLSCHSIARSAMDYVPYVRENAIQLLCPSSYYLPSYITHKDASVPQIWPRPPVDLNGKFTPNATKERKVLAFFAGACNSAVRQELLNVWSGDDKILIHQGRVPYPYSQALMTSKFCLQAKGFEVNTARLGDSMFYGCVPVVIADYYDLPYQDILDWTKFSIVVAQGDIPLLKKILEAVTNEQYAELHRQVMIARKHFQWHAPPQEYDAFHTVMYELWKRRHIVRSAAVSA